MTIEYKAPIEDMQFIYKDVLNIAGDSSIDSDSGLSNDLVDMILSEMAKFSEQVVAPLNASGDSEGCQLKDKQVTTPTGFKQAYQDFADGGWVGMTASEEYGGQDLPHSLYAAVNEMVTAANPGFSMYTGMNKGAISALKISGSEALKAAYMPKLVSGQWNATMNLTEAHAGTDLGLLRTKAKLQQDGSYKIEGSKIFISGGEHDLTDNIVHLVLARTPDSPKGSKGISIFIVPKFLSNEDGSLGERNAVYCTGIEKKMGLKGSATCSMQFDEATGYLIGNENEGLKIMFAMMNIMRIAVGGQGVALSDAAYQNASLYSKERLQGRTPGSTLSADKAEPIIKIPDVRRMLMSAKSFTEAARTFTFWLGHQMDIAEKSKNKEDAKVAEQLLGLLTPVLKGFLTETAENVISMSLQCFGGHGYITETGIEQYYRDARISKIYEGATGVQALDLIGRKVLMDKGAALKVFMQKVKSQCEYCKEHEELQFLADILNASLVDLEDASKWIMSSYPKNGHILGAASHHYLMLMGLTTTGYMWALMALKAKQMLDNNQGNKDFLQSKVVTANFYMMHYLVDTSSLVKKIKLGSEIVMTLDDTQI
ncbi:acyl-CoA dehydrogenase C-terminal domain-containing protein [Paraglaciecola arctica]|uniref:acyl-CoA dehydrogenase C-terminal domain-containing protein n=1 Tax=Paraglaciecola arctica TaxID=1128911 RepID=UPI001C07082C|nr:acyl-CoA dehydrogenase C-terminal domain-containing protein [Paraglaciecola arctica]MBU3004259.1 acyl-CoA dehydrogenase C-terminal domain-containing protein [Paraglaciecola arctica]